MNFLRAGLLVTASLAVSAFSLRAQSSAQEQESHWRRRGRPLETSASKIKVPVAAVNRRLLNVHYFRLQSVAEEKGNIVATEHDGTHKQLTDSGHDSGPVLSPDGEFVVFIRGTPGQTVSTGSGDVEATELWIVDRSGRKPVMLAHGREAKDLHQVLGGISGVEFSPDGHRLYFLTAAWATSGAVHVFDLATQKERFFTDGNALEIVPRGEYKGCLLIQKHKYFLGGGSYDWFWLVKPDGEEVGPVGEDPENFRSTYLK